VTQRVFAPDKRDTPGRLSAPDWLLEGRRALLEWGAVLGTLLLLVGCGVALLWPLVVPRLLLAAEHLRSAGIDLGR
jgi:hypothetical protein